MDDILIYVIAIVAALGFTALDAKAAETKYLQYNYNDKVVITISNVPCSLVGIKAKYDWAVRADRFDGEKLIGCYKKLTEDMIRIQWYKGDYTDLPANAFLQPKVMPVPKADM